MRQKQKNKQKLKTNEHKNAYHKQQRKVKKHVQPTPQYNNIPTPKILKTKNQHNQNLTSVYQITYNTREY